MSTIIALLLEFGIRQRPACGGPITEIELLLLRQALTARSVASLTAVPPQSQPPRASGVNLGKEPEEWM